MDAQDFAEQLQDAAQDYVEATQRGRLTEADDRAVEGWERFGDEVWDAAVDHARATSWVGMPGYVGGQS